MLAELVDDVKNALLNAGTLGVEQVSKKKDFEIYPNPAQNCLKIKSSGTINQIEIFNLNGQLYHPTINFDTVDVTNFNDGLYFLKIVFNDGRYENKRLIINKQITN